MIVQHDIVNRIKDYFDLNIYETKVWLALLGKGIASAGEIAEISRVPRSRTYDVLESLEKKGFAIVKIGKPVKYIGVKPNIILEKLKNNVRTDAEERIVSLSNIRSTDEFVKLEELYKGGISPVKKEDLSLALKGKSNISNHLREILQNAGKEVMICTNAKDMSYKSKIFHEPIENLKKSNIKINLALSGEDDLIKQIEDKLKIRIKRIKIESKFFIIDRKEILFYLSNDAEKEDVAIWLNSEFFANAFASLFVKAMGGK